MSLPVQNFKNHARIHPPFHFVLTPILLIHFAYTIFRLYRTPNLDNLDGVVLAFALILMALLTRVNPLKAQDRLIRLEEKLRYERVLAPDLARRASEGLTEGQMVALRFAPDQELPGLIEQVLSGKLKSSKEIKQAIVNWRADHFRV